MRPAPLLLLAALPSLALAFPQEAVTPPERPHFPNELLAVGDSVMLGAREYLLAIPGWDVSVDAVVCRQATIHVAGPTRCAGEQFPAGIPSGLEGLRAALAQGRTAQVVVLMLGSNEGVTRSQFDLVMSELAGVPRVVWMTNTVKRQQATNAMLRTNVGRYPNAALADWAVLSRGRPWFGKDRIHLNAAGRKAFAAVVARALPGAPVIQRASATAPAGHRRARPAAPPRG